MKFCARAPFESFDVISTVKNCWKDNSVTINMDQSELDDMDHTSRVEEIEALTAIYPGDIEVKEDEMIPLTNGEWKLHKQRGAIMTIYSNDEDRANSATLSVRLDVLTPPDYPSRSAPTYR